MPDESKTTKTVKYGGTSIGVGAGNAFTYFGIEYLRIYKGVTFDDPVVAMAMGGAIVSIIFVETSKVIGGLKYIFDRFFPAKNKPE